MHFKIDFSALRSAAVQFSTKTSVRIAPPKVTILTNISGTMVAADKVTLVYNQMQGLVQTHSDVAMAFIEDCRNHVIQFRNQELLTERGLLGLNGRVCDYVRNLVSRLHLLS